MTNLYAKLVPGTTYFAKTVVSILRAAIDAVPQEFRLQQITSRAKDPISLMRKLAPKGD